MKNSLQIDAAKTRRLILLNLDIEALDVLVTNRKIVKGNIDSIRSQLIAFYVFTSGYLRIRLLKNHIGLWHKSP